MQTTADHLNLAPPEPGRWLGPLGMALVAHGLLVAALTWGVGWQREAPPVVFEAEIWSPVPQAAAPRAVEQPPPPPVPRPPTPEPKPQPVAKPAPPPGPSQADIATAQAKKQAAEAAAKRSQAEAEKKAAAEKTAAANKAAAEQARLQQQRAQQQREREQALAEKELRDAQMRRIMGQAGASGGSTATGSAQRASGPSASYGGRVAARIKPNVVFTEAIAGNPRAEVEVRTLPDGTITARRIVTPSGNPAWDEAVLRAIDRTGTLPRDTDGRVPSSLIIGMSPQD